MSPYTLVGRERVLGVPLDRAARRTARCCRRPGDPDLVTRVAASRRSDEDAPGSSVPPDVRRDHRRARAHPASGRRRTTRPRDPLGRHLQRPVGLQAQLRSGRSRPRAPGSGRAPAGPAAPGTGTRTPHRGGGGAAGDGRGRGRRSSRRAATHTPGRPHRAGGRRPVGRGRPPPPGAGRAEGRGVGHASASPRAAGDAGATAAPRPPTSRPTGTGSAGAGRAVGRCPAAAARLHERSGARARCDRCVGRRSAGGSTTPGSGSWSTTGCTRASGGGGGTSGSTWPMRRD